MKKISIILAALATAFAVSCNKEAADIDTPDPSVPAGMKEVTISASIDDTATKTSYDAAGKFSWTKGDQISILASDNNFYTFTAKESAATSAFTGQIPEDCTIGRFSYFPASENHTYDSATWYSYFSIDEYRDMNGLASADIPMYGLKGEDDSFSFTHLTGAIQLTFTNIPANINEVEISVKSASLKYSGLWKISTGDWNWSAAVSEIDSELTYTRKVPVKNNTAQLYLPYKGQVWAASTINITGYDESENEIILLTDKALKGNGTAIERAQVVPYKELVLNNLAVIDWDDENVLTDVLSADATKRLALKELKLIADSHYLYARLICSKVEFEAIEAAYRYLGFFFCDVTDGTTGNGYYGWWNNAIGNVEYLAEHAGSFVEETLSLNFNGSSIDTKTEVSGDDIYWYLAFPRSSHEVLSGNKVYVAFFLNKNWDPTGALPDKYANMLEVTLP